MKFTIALMLVGIALTGCMESRFEDDLRGVPVTNNPTLFPMQRQIVQMPGIEN